MSQLLPARCTGTTTFGRVPQGALALGLLQLGGYRRHVYRSVVGSMSTKSTAAPQ
jgi:hypothetical protein